MNKYHIPLLPDTIYHIFNRAVGNEKLFREEDNYRYFLTKICNNVFSIVSSFCANDNNGRNRMIIIC